MNEGFRPQWVEVDTPAGRLRVIWPQPEVVYDGLEAVAVRETGAEPEAWLNGKAISMEQARALASGQAE
jgi:homospermidine synthase